MEIESGEISKQLYYQIQKSSYHYEVMKAMYRLHTWAKTNNETLYGSIELSWRLENYELSIDIAVPTGSRASVVLPDGIDRYTIEGKIKKTKQSEVMLEAGRYKIGYTMNK